MALSHKQKLSVKARITSLLKIVLGCVPLLTGPVIAYSQSPVLWTFKADSVRSRQALLIFEAKLADGWSIYTQYMNEGGPIPTRFDFDQRKDFSLIDGPVEQGMMNTYFDSIYAMNIGSYSDKVKFRQRIRLNSDSAFVRGKILYMVCDGKVCIPSKQEFSIAVESK